MNETLITQSIQNYLKKNNFFLIQCIYPGGQGALNYKVNGKPIYPDIIAFKGNTLIICENKPEYSESDFKKLKLLRESENLESKSQEILNNYCQSKNIPFIKIIKIDFYLGFKESNILPLNGIKFFNVKNSGEVVVLKS